MASLTGLRVGKETVSLYGKTNNVPIPHSLIVAHSNARQKYYERVENEKKEKAREKEEIRAKMQAGEKRKAEEKDRSDYLSKKKRFEDEEKEIRDVLKFDETRRKEFSMRLDNASNMSTAEIKSALALQKQIDESIAKKRAELEAIEKKKYKLVLSQVK